MKLERKDTYDEEYICDLTKALDNISKISDSRYYKLFYHYILIDNWCKKTVLQLECLAEQLAVFGLMTIKRLQKLLLIQVI